jgi:hypothetical protein
MNTMASTTKWTRLTRRLGLDHNPLRRRADLIAGWLLPAMLAALLVAGPLVAVVAGRWVQADDAAAWRAQHSWHPVPAVLLASSPGPMFPDGGANSWTVWTSARWTVSGRPHVGKVPAVSGSRAGATITVWLDQDGNPRLPLTAAAAGNRVITASALAVAALALLLASMAIAARVVLNRRRLASWEAAWMSAGPEWSGRR